MEEDILAAVSMAADIVVTEFLASMAQLHESVEGLARALVDSLFPASTPQHDTVDAREQLVRVCVCLYDEAVQQMGTWAEEFRQKQAEDVIAMLTERMPAQTATGYPQ
jgi:hypothetical protein